MKIKKFFVTLVVLFFIIIFDVLFSKLCPFYLRPNLWLVYITFVALFLNHTEAVIVGFVSGLIYDVLHLTLFGINTFLLTTTGYLLGWLNKHVNESLYKVQMLSILLSCIVYNTLYFLISQLFNTTKYNFLILLSVFSTFIVGFLALQILVMLYKKHNLI